MDGVTGQKCGAEESLQRENRQLEKETGAVQGPGGHSLELIKAFAKHLMFTQC